MNYIGVAFSPSLPESMVIAPTAVPTVDVRVAKPHYLYHLISINPHVEHRYCLRIHAVFFFLFFDT